MHPRVLRELVDTLARLLLIIFERLWKSGEVLGDWKKENVTPVFQRRRPRELRTNQPPLHPGKVIECLILEAIAVHMEDKRVIRSQHGFAEGKSCLTNLIAFYDETMTWMDEGWMLLVNGLAVDTVSLNFNKAFDSLSQHPHRRTQEVCTGCGLRIG
ncbi:RNA-directed DNA polymerase from mobile element jockey-like protein [Pitangus sulphuratus]|nr:RNA-directed DNA polymerase from mobile element jockey-like protein [Pitangus sulphuratus]